MITRTALALALLCDATAAVAASPSMPATYYPAVTVAAAERGTIVQTETITGTLVPREEVRVSPEVGGLAVTEICVEEGDTVEAGQVLAHLSRAALDASLAGNTAQIAHAQAAQAHAQAQLTEAESSRAEADVDLARAGQLVGSGAISQAAFDHRRATAEASAARVAAAEAAQRLVQADLMAAEADRQELLVRIAQTEIRAPVAGVVGHRTARLGAVVGSMSEPLFQLIAGGAVELEGKVPQTRLEQLRPGQPVSLTIPGRPASLMGRVRLVSPEMNTASRLGQVRLTLDGNGAGLPIGGFARAEVETARHQGTLIPLSAVMFGTDGPRVDVVADGIVDTRPVLLGLHDEKQTEVTEGLRPGEKVIAISGSFVRSGDRVIPVDAPASARKS